MCSSLTELDMKSPLGASPTEEGAALHGLNRSGEPGSFSSRRRSAAQQPLTPEAGGEARAMYQRHGSVCTSQASSRRTSSATQHMSIDFAYQV